MPMHNNNGKKKPHKVVIFGFYKCIKGCLTLYTKNLNQHRIKKLELYFMKKSIVLDQERRSLRDG
jgi:hypothetical protein